MQQEQSKLDSLQASYKAAVDEWVSSIRQEEALASVGHSVAKIDEWEDAHFIEDDLRSKVMTAKAQYQNQLRQEIFGL